MGIKSPGRRIINVFSGHIRTGQPGHTGIETTLSVTGLAGIRFYKSHDLR
jgi:hypothetical protein